MFSSFLASLSGEKLGHTKGPQDKKKYRIYQKHFTQEFIYRF